MRRIPPCERNPERSRRGTSNAQRGITTLELLIAAIIVMILLTAASTLLNASWKSYQNLVWQNKVNMEARQALDDICDFVRMSGGNNDALAVASTPDRLFTEY